MIDALKAISTPTDTAKAVAPERFTKNITALAAILGVSRRSLSEWKNDPRFATDCPKARSDGRFEIDAFRAWMQRHNLKHAADDQAFQNQVAANPDSDLTTRASLRLKREQVQLAKAEFELEKARQSMLPVAEFEAALAATVGAFVATISQVPGRAALKLVARVKIAALNLLRGALTENQFAKVGAQLDDATIEYGEIQQIIDAEIEHARRTLVQCKYLPAAPPRSGARSENARISNDAP